MSVVGVYLVVVDYGRGVISWYPVSVSIIQFLLKSMDSFGFHSFFTKLVPFIHNSMRKTILLIFFFVCVCLYV